MTKRINAGTTNQAFYIFCTNHAAVSCDNEETPQRAFTRLKVSGTALRQLNEHGMPDVLQLKWMFCVYVALHSSEQPPIDKVLYYCFSETRCNRFLAADALAYNVSIILSILLSNIFSLFLKETSSCLFHVVLRASKYIKLPILASCTSRSYYSF